MRLLPCVYAVSLRPTAHTGPVMRWFTPALSHLTLLQRCLLIHTTFNSLFEGITQSVLPSLHSFSDPPMLYSVLALSFTLT